MDAILPSGGRLTGSFAAETGAEIKALITFGGRTLLQQSIEAVRQTGRVERIVVVGPPEVRTGATAFGADAVIPEGISGPDNILRGLDHLDGMAGGPAEWVLVATTDLPFVTADAVTRFLEACQGEADAFVPITNRDGFERRFPGYRLEYMPLADGEWTMGCLFLLRAEVLRRNRAPLEAGFSARKSKLGLARLLGLRFIWRYLTHTLTSADVERRVGELLGCRGTAVRDCPPELVFDIDLPEEYRYAVEQCGVR